jgi:hypothetical protein
MKYKLLIILSTVILGNFAAFSQTQNHPLLGSIPNPYYTTIQEIQSVSGSQLATCDDKSSFHTLTVVVRGRMVTSGRTLFDAVTVGGTIFPAVQTTTGVNQYGRELPIQAGNGPFSGIWLRPNPLSVGECNQPLTPNDILDAVAGDSVVVMGVVDDTNGNGFGGNTQITPISFTILGITASNVPPATDGQNIEGIAPLTITAADLNDVNNINNLVTGEQYEGMFVELRDLTVIDYSRGTTSRSSIDFLENARYRIVCQDAAGNKIQIYDRFKAGRLPNDNTTSSTCGGQQVSAGGRLTRVPLIGGKYDYVRGILVHIKNQVPNQTCGNVATISSPVGPAFDRGYQIEPFFTSHYGISQYTPPIISDISIAPQAPSPSEPAVVSATIQAVDPGISISSATLYYSSDTINFASWSSVAMSNQGNTWSGSINNNAAAFTEGKTIYFYIKAADSRSPAAESVFPRVPITVGGIVGKDKPAAFVVRTNGLQISDVQKTPFTNGRSLYENRIVTLTGIATSTEKDLGIVTIQDENATEWGAIFLESNAYLSTVKKGDKITVSGKIVEQNSGGTSIITMLKELNLAANVIPISSNNTISPLLIDHTLLSGNYEFRRHEKYEAMNVQISAPTGKLFVVDTNADFRANFSEYRIGTDTTALLNFPATLTGSARNTAVVGTRVLAGRSPAYASTPTATFVISSQVFPLITNPVITQTSAGSNFLPDTATLSVKFINKIYADRRVSFDNISGVAQHSFGNMKLLPRDVFDINGLKINGIDAVKTLPGFTTSTSTELENKLLIYPNPSSGKIAIFSQNQSQCNITILNMMGTEVLRDYSFNKETELELSHLPKGIYILKINKSWTHKLVLE